MMPKKICKTPKHKVITFRDLQILHRVGRQGTLLCKEINIGYLKRLNYLPLRGENEVNTSVFITVFLQN